MSRRAAVVQLRLRELATPEGIRLQRILATESWRLPELVDLAFGSSTGLTVPRRCPAALEAAHFLIWINQHSCIINLPAGILFPLLAPAAAGAPA